MSELLEYYPLSLMPMANPNVDEGEHQVLDAQTAYVFKIQGSRERAEEIVSILNERASATAAQCAVTAASFTDWLDAQIAQAADQQRQSYAMRAEFGQRQGERWHARQCALYEVKLKIQSCGADLHRHSGAVDDEKRAEQSNPGGEDVTHLPNSQNGSHQPKPLPDEPTPAAGRCSVSEGERQASPLWRHKKRGSVVREVARGFAQVAVHPIEEMTAVVIYQHISDGAWWVRNAVEFDDGRFEPIDPAQHSSTQRGGGE